MEAYLAKMDNMIEATWEGLDRGRGKVRLKSDGSLHTGPVNRDAKSLKKGDKCWWDGKTIYILPSIKRPEEKKRRKPKQANSDNIVERVTQEEPKTTPFTYYTQLGNRWRHTFGQSDRGSWFLSTPSGVIPLPEAGWFSDVWDYAKAEMLAGNFWLTTYPAPTNYTGWYQAVVGQHYGTIASSWTENTFIFPYVHQYQLDFAKELNLRVLFSPGQDTTSFDSNYSVEIQYYTRGDRIEGFDIMTMAPATNGFVGSARNKNTAIMMETTVPSKIIFSVGDKVNIVPQRRCVIENTQPCYNRSDGWAPLEYIAYGDPFGGGAALPGCEVTITKAPRKVLAGDPIYTSYENWTVIEGTPKPAFTEGNTFGFGAQFGYLAACLTDQDFGPNPTKEQLAGHWASYSDRALYCPQVGGPDWIVQDLSGNEPPLPPLQYGYVDDSTHRAGDWWYTSSRNGVFYGYDIFHVWEWREGVTWNEAWGSQAANSQFQGRYGAGSISLCREYTEANNMPGGTLNPTFNPYKSPLVIARVRIDTENQTVDFDTFEYVETAVCNGPDAFDCGYWADDFYQVLEAYAWPDDPRILDGVGFETINDYHYDDVTGFLWEAEIQNNSSASATGPNATDKKWVGSYWRCPDDVQPGTQAFYDWVESPGTQDGELEWAANPESDLNNYFAANDEFYYIRRYPVLMRRPKTDTP